MALDIPNLGILLVQIPVSYHKGNIAFPAISQLVQWDGEGHQVKVAMMVTSLGQLTSIPYHRWYPLLKLSQE